MDKWGVKCSKRSTKIIHPVEVMKYFIDQEIMSHFNVVRHIRKRKPHCVDVLYAETLEITQNTVLPIILIFHLPIINLTSCVPSGQYIDLKIAQSKVL